MVEKENRRIKKNGIEQIKEYKDEDEEVNENKKRRVVKNGVERYRVVSFQFILLSRSMG